MSRKQLRPYQEEVFGKLKKRLKEVKYPLLVNASVGSGKSLLIAELLLMIERAGWRALCLTLNSELIRQNVAVYQNQGGKASIYCASLKEKDCSLPIVFASPHSIHFGLKKNSQLQAINFNLIVIDEAHNVNPNDKKSMYIQLLNHYGLLSQEKGYSFRVVGLTGTPYRGKGHIIFGENCYFKESVCEITTAWLIENNYLVKPFFGIPKETIYDFSKVRISSTGLFNHKDLQNVLDKNTRLTGKIMRSVSKIVTCRNGAFIFASTIRHCQECLEALPKELTKIITGDTPINERIDIIEKARAGKIKYLVNVNVLTVGVDVPNFDTVVFVRPTESLVLYTQAIGRGLRLSPLKSDCLILDYAGNLDRHGDIDNPIINSALKNLAENNPDYCIPCSDCGTYNTIYGRRCIGLNEKKRCEHFFDWKNCHKCNAVNDKVARICRECDVELIDPNAKLSLKSEPPELIEADVIGAKYWINELPGGGYVFHAIYDCTSHFPFSVSESYYPNSLKAKNIFYYKFVKIQIKNPSRYFYMLDMVEIVKNMIKLVSTPHTLLLKWEANKFVISKKIFKDACNLQ